MVSGGHSNAIRSFIACQRPVGIKVAAVAPWEAERTGREDLDFPLLEVDSLRNVRWNRVREDLDLSLQDTVVHFHSVHVSHRFARLISDLRRVGIPYALTSHGQLSFRSRLHWLEKFVYLQLLDHGPRNAAGLHLLTQFAADRLKFLLPGYRGITLVQGNLPKVPNLAALPPALAKDFGLPEGAFVLLFLGRLDVHVKGLDFLVEAFSRLAPDPFRLVLAGPDWEGGKAKLERLADRLGCRNRILFPGPIYGAQKWGLLRAANVFVSPSRWEAFSVAHVEALACGLPMVTSNTIAMAPELSRANAALLVPPRAGPLAEALSRLEKDRELLRALGDRGRMWTEMNCSPERAGTRFLEFYQTILNKYQRKLH